MSTIIIAQFKFSGEKQMKTMILAAVLLTCNVAIAKEMKFTALATSAQVVPANESTATAKVKVIFDQGFTKVDVEMAIDGLASVVVAAHFHCNRAGANGAVAFGILQPGPLFEISNIGANVTLTNEDALGDCTGFVGRGVNNVAALAQAMDDGLIYINFHTTEFPAGEFRGQMIRKK